MSRRDFSKKAWNGFYMSAGNIFIIIVIVIHHHPLLFRLLHRFAHSAGPFRSLNRCGAFRPSVSAIRIFVALLNRCGAFRRAVCANFPSVSNVFANLCNRAFGVD